MRFANLAGKRKEKQQLYEKGGAKLAGAGKASRWGGILLGLSAVLVGWGIYMLLMVYGPVAVVEARYQVKSISKAMGSEDRGLVGWVLPDFSWDPLGMEFGEEGYGLVIPKIFIEDEVVLNVDPTNKNKYLPALSGGIAHAAGTALPGDGGVGYYFAHSSGIGGLSTGFDAKFYLLGKLEVGDEVVLYRNGERYEYVVVESRVMNADEVDFLAGGEIERVVLQTCWPAGTSARRLVVTAEREV